MEAIPKELQIKAAPSVGCLFLHTINGSPGSYVRIRELSLALAGLGAKMHILTPYERGRSLASNVHITSIPNLALHLGLAPAVYSVSRRAFYNRFAAAMIGTKHNWVLEQLSQRVTKVLRNSNINILQAEQDFSLSICTMVKHTLGIPLVADIHNITAEELVSAGVIRRDGDAFLDLQRRNAEHLSHADVVVVVSDLMKRYVESAYNIVSNKVVVVPPGGRVRKERVRQNRELKVVYSGLVSYRENVELFVRSMPFIQERHGDARFFITRKGESLGRVKKLAAKMGISPEYFWYEKTDEFYRFLSSCYLGVLPSSDDMARRMGTPVKLFDYMSMGLPVVANDIGEWTEIISRHGTGVVTGSDPRSFANGVEEVIANRDRYSENALRLVTNHYNWDKSAAVLFGVYQQLLQ